MIILFGVLILCLIICGIICIVRYPKPLHCKQCDFKTYDAVQAVGHERLEGHEMGIEGA